MRQLAMGQTTLLLTLNACSNEMMLCTDVFTCQILETPWLYRTVWHIIL